MNLTLHQSNTLLDIEMTKITINVKIKIFISCLCHCIGPAKLTTYPCCQHFVIQFINYLYFIITLPLCKKPLKCKNNKYPISLFYYHTSFMYKATVNAKITNIQLAINYLYFIISLSLYLYV